MLILLGSCSVEKNTGLSRNYHNLLSRYNIYFNGNESYKNGLRKINKQFKDDFSQLLPVFKYEDKNIASSVSSDMDRAITKASKVITLHSITAKPEMKDKEMTEKEKEFYDRPEFNDWVDDSYLLMGKAQTLKHDYFLAIKTFKYLNMEAQDEDVKYESMIWLAYVYGLEEEFEKAGEILESLKEDEIFTKEHYPFYYSVYADHHIKQENYSSAIEMLEKSLKYEKKKENKYRYTYILAQLFEKTGHEQQAYKNFAMVVRMNPPYDMTFNARIRQAESFDISNENVAELKKILRKMLRDEKNIEYRDQIYYAYGQIAIKEGKKDEAIKYYKESAHASVQNNKQKGISYLSIADIYFEVENYVPAQAYYDSALMNLSPEYPGYSMISSKSAHLNSLVSSINIIEREDSLQLLAAMSPVARLAVIDKIISDLREEERKKKEQEALSPYSQSDIYEGERRLNRQLNQSGKWYFYNPAVVDFGRNEFKKKWGDRKLEDNWRRKDKTVLEMNISDMNMEAENAQGQGEPVEKDERFKRDYYLKDIPDTKARLLESSEKIEKALFAKGSTYMSDLKDYPMAIETYEELLDRFPENSYLLSCYYYLYDMNKNIGNSVKTGYYESLILTKFPESEFAQMLSDPDYIKKRNEKEMEVYRLYESLYAAYLNEEYARVIKECETALKIYPFHELMPKFYLLRAYAIGSISDIQTFKAALKEMVDTVPGGEEKLRAAELIAHFNETVPELKAEDEKAEAKQIYNYSANEAHLLVLAILEGNTDMNQLIFNIINFNYDNYPQAEFTVNKQILDNGVKLVFVEGTGNAEKTMEYYRIFIPEKTIKGSLKNTNYKAFVISVSNYNVFVEHQEVSVYEKFFNSNYLSPEVSGKNRQK